jgi:nucleoside-diphosphate-sugar epimerase
VKNIFITGSTGFVGKNIIKYFNSKFEFYNYSKNEEININQDVVLHFAGKAHDLKNTSNVQEYYVINTELTKDVFDNFLVSVAKVFITLSSAKAAADELNIELTEAHFPNPVTHYGKSKLLAEQYILSKEIPVGKRVYILRPCMIHGQGNKGNLNLLYKIVSKGFPWPLGAFENKRSFCSIDNLCFIIKELIENSQIPSGIYNIADEDPVSTNELISLIAGSQSEKPHIWNIPKFFIYAIAKIGDVFRLPLNTERLQKLTENYILSNKKIREAINKPLPFSAKEGLLKTINSFQNNA